MHAGGTLGVCSCSSTSSSMTRNTPTGGDRPDDVVVRADVFPTERFDAISEFPGRSSPGDDAAVPHIGSKWTLAAGAEVSSKRNMSAAPRWRGGVYTVVYYLNEYYEEDGSPPNGRRRRRSPTVSSATVRKAMAVHERHKQPAGHMECLLCHKDHMKALLNRRATK